MVERSSSQTPEAPLSLLDTGPQGPGGLEPVDREMSCGLCVNIMDGPV